VATAPSLKKVYNYCDNNFRRITVTQAPGTSDEAITTVTYDPAGNQLTVTGPNGQPGMQYPGAHTTAAYDARNRRVSVNDALNQTTSWAYDKAGNLIKETRPDTKYRTWDTFDPMNRVTHTTGFRTDDTAGYVYDLAGNMTQMTDSKGANYAFGYDLLNRKTSATYPLPAPYNAEAFTYDIAGNLSTYTPPYYFWIKTFGYDNRNRPTSATWNNTYGGTVNSTTVYDAASRVTSIVSGPTTVAFGYDDANHKTWEDQTLTGFPTRHVQTPVDVDGNRSNLIVAGYYNVWYAYNQRNQVSAVANLFSYTYDPNGNVTKRQHVGGGTNDSTNWTYDELNRPTLCQQTGANDALFATSHTGYDALSNVQYTYRDYQQGKGERFGYDFANQLNSVVYDADNVNTTTPSGWDRSVSYTNTPLNRTSMNDNGAVTNYTPNGLNQYTAVNTQTPVYDGNFNLYSYGGWTYVYDADKRLTSTSGNGHSAQFVYDGLGRCVKRTIDTTQVTVFTYDGWKPMLEWDGTGTFGAWNIYGFGADEILQRHSTAYGDQIYHPDAMGNVQFLLDASGNGIEKYTYDVFGQPTITDWAGTVRTTSAYGNRFMFTGREYLSTLGIYDYRNRAYHPGLGRFLQVDPIGFGGGDANLFRYVGNNPVNRGDPSGLVDLPKKLDGNDGDNSFFGDGIASGTWGTVGNGSDTPAFNNAGEVTFGVGVGAPNRTGAFGDAWDEGFDRTAGHGDYSPGGSGSGGNGGSGGGGGRGGGHGGGSAGSGGAGSAPGLVVPWWPRALEFPYTTPPTPAQIAWTKKGFWPTVIFGGVVFAPVWVPEVAAPAAVGTWQFLTRTAPFWWALWRGMDLAEDPVTGELPQPPPSIVEPNPPRIGRVPAGWPTPVPRW
jgi:RHS repeat-associated protein